MDVVITQSKNVENMDLLILDRCLHSRTFHLRHQLQLAAQEDISRNQDKTNNFEEEKTKILS